MLFRIYCLMLAIVMSTGAGCLGANSLREGLSCRNDADCKGPVAELFCNQDNVCEAKSCQTGDKRSCFTGTQGCVAKGDSFDCKGLCTAGSQVCKNSFWGPCKGQVLPTKESCLNGQKSCCDGLDNNCDGNTDETFPSDKICSLSELAKGAGGLAVCNKGKEECKLFGGLVYLQSGESTSFQMGSPKSAQVRQKDEGPISISFSYNYGISGKEVTQKEFLDVMGYNPEGNTGNKNLPVSNITWDEAAMYTKLLSEKQKLISCFECSSFDPSKKTPFTGKCEVSQKFTDEALYVLSCPGYRLPTEAEWEYAYRTQPTGGVYKEYYNGDGADKLNLIGWYKSNAGGTSHNTGEKLPNSWKIFDMSGNVAEWVFDRYKNSLSGNNNDRIGPTAQNVSNPAEHVYRGGHFDENAAACRGARRNKADRNAKKPWLGFRIARSVLKSK